MARLYGEPVEVQTGEDGLPAWFGWRRRRYAVHAVQEASAGKGHPAGIYELRRDVAAEVWTLRRVED